LATTARSWRSIATICAHTLWGWEADYLAHPNFPPFISFTQPFLNYARAVFLGSVLGTFGATDTFYATLNGLKIFLL